MKDKIKISIPPDTPGEDRGQVFRMAIDALINAEEKEVYRINIDRGLVANISHHGRLVNVYKRTGES